MRLRVGAVFCESANGCGVKIDTLQQESVLRW